MNVLNPKMNMFGSDSSTIIGDFQVNQLFIFCLKVFWPSLRYFEVLDGGLQK